MWPTEGAGSAAPTIASERGSRSRLLAVGGVLLLLAVAAVGTWLSVRGGQPANPSIYAGPSTAAGSVWTWDGSRFAMMPVRGQAPTSNHSDMAYDRPSGLIVLWDHGCARMVMGFQGGCDSQVNRTWTWNGDAWTATPARSSPIAMGQGGMVFDARLAKVVYVNGAGQVWSWTASGWNSVPVRGAPGVGAAGQTLAVGYDEGRSLVVLVQADSTWLWDGDAWTVRSGGIGVANGHAAGQVAYDAARAQLVFVGEGATWTWDGALWQRHDQAGITGGALGYDAARSTLVLVQQDSSACDHTACSTTTWVWAQSLWSRLAAPGPVLPVTRSGAFAIPTAFDEARGVLVLFASAT